MAFVSGDYRLPRKVDLVRIRQEKNERRFYSLDLDFDLFGSIVVLRYWGRIGTAGKFRLDKHSTLTAAAGALQKMQRQKLRTGYRDRRYNSA